MAKKAAEPKTKGKTKKVVEEAPVKKGKGKGKKVVEETPVEEVAEVEETVEEAPVKKGKGKGKGKKAAEPVKRGRGRIAGVRNELTKKDQAAIQEQFTAIEEQFDEFVENVGTFIEKGNKSSVSKARKNIQEMTRMGKVFRKTLQDAKLGMKQVPVA